jgi:tetratricopeptide (TPR) repeat protein
MLGILAPLCALAQHPGPDSVQAARSHFKKGVEYYADGDHASALLEFERAYELHPTYRLLYNLGQVAHEQKDYVAAQRYFADYLEQAGDEIPLERRRAVQRDLRRLKGRIGMLQLRVNRTGAVVFIDGHRIGRTPLDGPLSVSAGRRNVRVEHTGHVPVDRIIDVVGAERVAVRIDVGPSTQNGQADTASAPRVPVAGRPAFWMGMAAGALAAGGGGLAYSASRDSQAYQDALGRTTTRPELDSFATSARNKALAADVLFGAALASGVVTLVLWLTRDHSTQPVVGSGRVAPARDGSVRVSF